MFFFKESFSDYITARFHTASDFRLHDRDTSFTSQKRNNIPNRYSNDIKKRTLTPNTPDTPDMTVEIPDTPETPDTKNEIPNVKETPESSGLFMSGDDDDEDTSGDNSSSGYADVESGTHKPILWLSTPFGRRNKTNGSFKVSWKPEDKNKAKINIKGVDFNTKTTAGEQITIKENDQVLKEAFQSNNEKVYIKDLQTNKNILDDKKGFDTLLETNMLNHFLSITGRSAIPKTNYTDTYKNISDKTGDAKKSKIHRQRGLMVRTDTQGSSYKKQGLEMPFDDREAIGGEPIGNIESNRLDGLGSEMHGYPVGMGGGGEPLGAYEPREQSGPGDFPGGMQQGLDEGPPSFGGSPLGFSKDLPPMGFNRGYGNQPMSNNFDNRQPMEGLNDANTFPNFRPGLFDPTSDGAAESIMGPQQQMQQGFLNPQPAMTESMSNSLDNIGMDKANVQGDSEVGQMVRARGQPMPGNFDSPMPDQNGSPFNEDNRYLFDAPTSEEYKNFKKSNAQKYDDEYDGHDGFQTNQRNEMPQGDETEKRGEEVGKLKEKQDEVNFWKKNGDVHFDDIKAVEDGLDGENFNMIKKYGEEDSQTFYRPRQNNVFRQQHNLYETPNNLFRHHSREMSFYTNKKQNEGWNKFLMPEYNGYGRSSFFQQKNKNENRAPSMIRGDKKVMNFIGRPSSYTNQNQEWKDILANEKLTEDAPVPRSSRDNTQNFEMTAYSSDMMNMAQLALERKRTNINRAKKETHFERHKKLLSSY